MSRSGFESLALVERFIVTVLRSDSDEGVDLAVSGLRSGGRSLDSVCGGFRDARCETVNLVGRC